VVWILAEDRAHCEHSAGTSCAINRCRSYLLAECMSAAQE